jgi:hypothetical protein
MRVFHSPPNFLLRAAVLPMLFLRIFSALVYIARSRFHYAATESSDVIKRTELAVIVLLVVECMALSLFTIVHHQKDGSGKIFKFFKDISSGKMILQ